MNKKYLFGQSIPDGYLYGQKIDERHIEEASEIILKYPDYYHLVDEYQRLIGDKAKPFGFQSVQRINAARKLREIGQRGLDIHAWSTTYDNTEKYLNLIQSDDELCKAFTECGPGRYSEYFDGQLKWNRFAGVIFSLPTCGTLTELYLRLLNGSNGSGIIGIPSNIGYIFMGTAQPFEVINRGPYASEAIIIWKKDSYTVGVKHGAYNFELSLGVTLSYLHAVLEGSFEAYRAVSIAGRLQLSSVVTRLLDNILPGEQTTSLLQSVINAGTGLWDRIWGQLKGSLTYDVTDQIAATTRYNLEGYQPFGGPMTMVVALPGYTETLNQHLVGNANSHQFGDHVGFGAKELFTESVKVIDQDSGKLVNPTSGKGIKLIQDANTSSFKITGYRNSPLDETIQGNSDWQNYTGADEESIVYWAFASNAAGILNGCRYYLGG